tara:strand:+ start:1299 stop:1970 length:672 start_codon:yes stop_codon:yes gene_type:complete
MASIMNPLYKDGKKRKNYGTSKPATIGGKKAMPMTKRAKTPSKPATKPKAVKKRTTRSTMNTATKKGLGSPFTKKIGTGATKKMPPVVSAATIRKLSPTEKSQLQKILKKNQELQNKAKKTAAAEVIKSNINKTVSKNKATPPPGTKITKGNITYLQGNNSKQTAQNIKDARVNKREADNAKRLSATKKARVAQRKKMADQKAKNAASTKSFIKKYISGKKYK